MSAVLVLWPIVLVLLIAFLGLTAFYTNTYANFLHHPFLLFIPLAALVGLFGVKKMVACQKFLMAWLSSALFILGVTFFGVLGMFPGMIISTIDPAATVTAFNGCSSDLTLEIMLVVALVMVPIVLLYQFWAYRLFSHKLDADTIADEEHAY